LAEATKVDRSGGKPVIEKVKISQITSDKDVKNLPDDELLNLHRRLHQLYGAARARGEATEYPWVNVHVWTVEEMERRGMNHNIHDDLDRETERLLTKAEPSVPDWVREALQAGQDAVIVPDYVSLVGSAVEKDEPHDIDLLVREDEDKLSKGWRESVHLIARKMLDPFKDKGLKFHILANPQGPHIVGGRGYIPLFDLVLRPKKEAQIAKSASAMPNWELWLNQAPQGRRIDLGPGFEGPPPGFEGLGRPYDLDETWPLEPESVAVLRANHVFEHLASPAHAMREAWRVLMPGGLLIVTVPEFPSTGSVAHPEHVSFWNADSFKFWTNPELLRTVEESIPEPFELLYLAQREEGSRRYVDAVLRKVVQEPAQVSARALVPITLFKPPKPAMKMRAHTDAFSPEEVWPWVEKHLEAGVVAEEKYNGFRAILQKKGNKISCFFEDSQQERWDKLLAADTSLQAVEELPDFILDCDIGVIEGGKRWPRPKLMALTADHPSLPEGAHIDITAFDLLYWDGESFSDKTFKERREKLEEVEDKLNDVGIDIPKEVEIRDKQDLIEAWKSPEFGLADRSEGLVLKSLDWVYKPGLATDGMAKIKHALEVKAIVLEVKRTKDGDYNFRGGILPGRMLEELDNLVEYKGQKYVDLGFSYNAPFEAKVGDIITAEVEEITWDMPDKRLNWLGAQPLDVDKERDAPYAAAQVIDMASRAKVLQEVEKSVRRPIGAPGGKYRVAQRLIEMIPPHRTYVEPYAGGAAVFWKKEPSEREVLNDINSDIVVLYQFLQKATDDEFEEFCRRDWVGKESTFERLRTEKPRSLADKAYRAWYLGRFGYRKLYSPAKGNFHHYYEGARANVNMPRLKALRERLKGVTILNKDALDVIKQYDAPDTFFYLDPPYLGADAGYNDLVSVEHFQELGKILRNLKGKALISGDRETIEALDLPSSWHVRKIKMKYSLPRQREHYYRFELLASNYELAKRLHDNYEQEESHILAPFAVETLKAEAELEEKGDKDFPKARQFFGALGSFYPIKQKTSKADSETRGEAALRNWEQNWYEAMPISGKPLPFILHAHWRGLTEEEAKLDMDELLQTNNSLHFDLRLGTDQFNGWWGISLFAGTTEENREELRIFRMMHDPDEKLESWPKQFGPKAWLSVGVEGPLVVPPAGVGSTSKAWSKFFAVDRGTWRLGFARVHGVEIWLDGQHLKGRFMWQYAPLEQGGERQWLFTRPADQTPYAATHDFADVVSELARKGQKYLFWPKDTGDLSEGMLAVDVQKEAKKLTKYSVVKQEEERRYTLGIAYPAEKVDAHGDYTTPQELEEAAWTYLKKVQEGRASVGLMHQSGTSGAGTVVESYIYRGPDWEVNGQVVKAGDWLLGVIWNEKAWELIKKGYITGYSIQGLAHKEGE
jgi:site-specific DNA-adenine methylase/SAM-dependent methyltransferase